MNFFIKQNSTLPELKFPLTEKIMEMYNITPEMLEDVAVTFSMIDEKTGHYRIANVPANLVVNDNKPHYPDETKYTLVYRFNLKQTSSFGNYLAEFKVDFLGESGCGKITFPMDEKISIIIKKSITKTEVIKLVAGQQVPIAGLIINPSGILEIGSTFDFTLTPSYQQNDAGPINYLTFKRDSTLLEIQNDLTPYIDVDQTVQAGTIQYSVSISYNKGSVNSGIVDASASYSGEYYNWYGPYGVSAPTGGTDIRTVNSTFNNTFTINTGTVDLFHVVAIPSTRTLNSIIDVDASYADITSNYNLSNTILTVPDGGGNNVSYKVYILELAIPYSTNHRHNVTIT